MTSDSSLLSRSNDYGWRYPCLLSTRARSAGHPSVLKRWLIDHQWNQSLCIVGDCEFWLNGELTPAAEASAHPLIQDVVNKPPYRHSVERCIAKQQFRSLLGLEFDCLIYDAFSGIHPDAITALTGCLKAGGIFVFYGPPLTEWHSFRDPDMQRLLAYPANKLQSSNFLRYLQRAFEQSMVWNRLVFNRHQLSVQSATDSFWARLKSPQTRVTGITRSNEINDHHKFPQPNCAVYQSSDLNYPDQLNCILKVLAQLPTNKIADTEASKHQATPDKSISVISSARGRGKSAALGIIAARWLASQYPARFSPALKVVVTAPSRDRVSILFKHAKTEWLRLLQLRQSRQHGTSENHALAQAHVGSAKSAKATKSAVRALREHLVFKAPDDLLQSLAGEANSGQILLVIDEAASLPLPLLSDLLKSVHSCVLAATTAGYEGCGQGFRLRLLPALKAVTANFQLHTLQQPIRWRSDDPLENFIDAVFMLANTENNAQKHHQTNLSDETDNATQTEVREYRPSELLANSSCLEQVFQLLTMAHYRTTPDDLRILLDCPEVRLLVATSNGSVIACLLLAEELPFADNSLREQIWAGRRRPKGHLIQQSLAQHLNIKQALEVPVSRIIRIAVHPAHQGRGVGSWLLQQLPHHLRSTTALQGTSYATEPLVNQFWLHNGYQPVRLGLKRDAFSGSHSALMIKPVSELGRKITRYAQQRFVKRCCYEKLHHARDFTKKTTGFSRWAWAKKSTCHASIDSQDLLELTLFSEGKRPLPIVMDTLFRAANTPTSFHDNQVWQHCIVQRLSLPETALKSGLNGKKAVANALRQAAADWVNLYRSERSDCTIVEPTKD